jgi:excinuclease ABC subunit C
MINLNSLPEDSGCYLFKNLKNEIIYIGKAKSLKKRVISYFQKTNKDEKTKSLVKEIHSVEFFATTNEVEALILENNLIQKHKPLYNINLKDSRKYAYIIMTDEEYPRLMVARDRSLKGSYYGPFVSAEYRDNVIKALRQAFYIRTCSKLPKKACLRHHIGLCLAPCIKNISKDDYAVYIKNAEKFLKGDTAELIKKLNSEMEKKSENMHYEQAKILRDQINAVNFLNEKQKFEVEKRYDEDIINYAVENEKVYLIVFNISRGILATKNEFSFDYKEGFFEEFLIQYYFKTDVPKEIIIPHALKDDSIPLYLEKLRKGKVEIAVPKKGDKLSLLNLVKRNIEISFLSENKKINALKDSLELNSTPKLIECFDISNISGTNMVGSMVRFDNAHPDKSNYRRFKIKTVIGIDDFASINEIVKRRYKRLKEEKKEMPDLIVIDGGKGQLSSAVDALKSLELKIPIISLAKKFEEIYVPNKEIPLRLPKNSDALKLLMQIRDEAHRFGVKYHRLLRSKEMISE